MKVDKMDEGGWKLMKVDKTGENGWNWIKSDENGWKWMKVDEMAVEKMAEKVLTNPHKSVYFFGLVNKPPHITNEHPFTKKRFVYSYSKC